MKSGAQVEIKSVSKKFSGRDIVFDNISFTVAAGDFVSLLGPSGCGKSTLLRLIAGLEKADAGSVNVESQVPVQRSFVFQEPTLLPWRTVFKNVVLPFELRKQKIETAHALGILEAVGLKDAINKFPHQLSGGMKMRVSIARALVTQPSLLLLDEPFSALDETTRYLLQTDLRQLWSNLGMTVVFVTHSLAEAVFLSERIIALRDKPAKIILDETLSFDDSSAEKKSGRYAPNFRTSVAFNDEVVKLQKVFS